MFTAAVIAAVTAVVIVVVAAVSASGNSNNSNTNYMGLISLFSLFFNLFFFVFFTDNRLVIVRGCHPIDDTNCSSDLHIPIAKISYKKTLISIGNGTTCLCKNNLCNEHQWDTLIGARSSKDNVFASVTPFSRSAKNSVVVVGDDTKNITSSITMSTINDDKSNPINSGKSKAEHDESSTQNIATLIDARRSKDIVVRGDTENTMTTIIDSGNQSSAAKVSKNGCGGYDSIHILNIVIIIMYSLLSQCI